MPRVLKLVDIVGAVSLSLLYAKPAAGGTGTHNRRETIAGVLRITMSLSGLV